MAEAKSPNFSDSSLGSSSEDSGFDMDGSMSSSSGENNKPSGEQKESGNSSKIKQQSVANQHHDLEVSLDGSSMSDESVDTLDGDNGQSPKMRDLSSKNKPPTKPKVTGNILGSDSSEEGSSNSDDDDSEDSDKHVPDRHQQYGVKLDKGDTEMQKQMAAARAKAMGKKTKADSSDGSGDSSGSSSEDDDSGSENGNTANRSSVPVKGGYNPAAFAHLDVSSEVRELFEYIGRYKPHDIELDTTLKCFIPDYIPAVGTIDSFIKVPRPDGEPEALGVTLLDEPSASQSDSTVLDLQLRAISKKSNLGDTLVRSIENAEKNPKAVRGWIKSIKELHRTKPPPQVNYSKPMPDIESLMQVWPEDFESLLSEVDLPGGEIDLNLKDYVKVICALLDIPVFDSMTESLHVLFTLFSEFRNNQHFQPMAPGA